MAVTLKKKVSPKAATAMIVDRIIELKKQVDAVSPQAKEMAKLVADLRAQAMEQDPDQVVAFEGTDSTIVFGEAAHTRSIGDMVGVKKALGNDTFFEIAKVSLSDIDKYLTPEEIAPLIEEGRGARRMDIVDK